jgi:hypothetical protein
MTGALTTGKPVSRANNQSASSQQAGINLEINY